MNLRTWKITYTFDIIDSKTLNRRYFSFQPLVDLCECCSWNTYLSLKLTQLKEKLLSYFLNSIKGGGGPNNNKTRLNVSENYEYMLYYTFHSNLCYIF